MENKSEEVLLNNLVEKINNLNEELLVHSIQFVSANYPSFNSQAWRTLSLSISRYNQVVNSFLAYDKETGEYSRSLLEREYEDKPFLYFELGEEPLTINTNDTYKFNEIPASKSTKKENSNIDTADLWMEWATYLKLEFKTGSTMWISQSYKSFEERQMVSSIFLLFTNKITDDTIKYKIAKLCRDFMVDYLVKFYQYKLQEKIRVIDKDLLKIIDNINDDIFTGPEVLRIFREFRFPIYSRVPLLIKGEIGSGKLSVARAIYELRKNIHDDEVTRLIEINLGLGGDDTETFISNLKEQLIVAQQHKNNNETDSVKLTIIFDDIHLASIKIQYVLKQLLDYSFNYGPSPLPDIDNIDIDKVIFISIQGKAGDVPLTSFLEEFWFRISLFQILVPPLRYRYDELPQIVKSMHDRIISAYDLDKVKPLSEASLAHLKTFNFPGNYKELFNILLKAQFFSPDEDEEIQPQYLEVGW